jgi:hypothetical protein
MMSIIYKAQSAAEGEAPTASPVEGATQAPEKTRGDKGALNMVRKGLSHKEGNTWHEKGT